jgi:hypothetical protein
MTSAFAGVDALIAAATKNVNAVSTRREDCCIVASTDHAAPLGWADVGFCCFSQSIFECANQPINQQYCPSNYRATCHTQFLNMERKRGGISASGHKQTSQCNRYVRFTPKSGHLTLSPASENLLLGRPMASRALVTSSITSPLPQPCLLSASSAEAEDPLVRM